MFEAHKRKILLIGQAPSKSGVSAHPLEGRIGKKIADLAGIPMARYMTETDRANVLDHWPGRSEKGDTFPMREARDAATKKVFMLKGRRVIFVGKATASAFGVHAEYLEWQQSPTLGCRFAILPHPSGIVRWWNDPANARLAAKFLREVFD